MARKSGGLFQRIGAYIGAKAKALQDIWQSDEYGILGKILNSKDELQDVFNRRD